MRTSLLLLGAIVAIAATVVVLSGITREEEGITNIGAETTVDYSVVTPEGGVGVAVLPKVSPTAAGSDVSLNIKIVSTENVDDIFHVYLTTDGIPLDYQANLTWFNWTSEEVQIPAGGGVVIPLEASIPGDVSSYKEFRAVAVSTLCEAVGYDTGILNFYSINERR